MPDLLLFNTIRTVRAALLPSLVWAGLFFLAGLFLLGRRGRLYRVWLLLLSLYAGFLFYGTVFSRVGSVQDFFHFRLPAEGSGFVWHLNPSSTLSLLHFASNILLFLPFGFFALLSVRRSAALPQCVLMGFFTSCCIELFQLLHGLLFDFGDLTANTLGTLLGCLLGLPFCLAVNWISALWQRRRQNRSSPQR